MNGGNQPYKYHFVYQNLPSDILSPLGIVNGGEKQQETSVRREWWRRLSHGTCERAVSANINHLRKLILGV